MRTKLDRILTLLALATILAPLGCGDDRSSIRRYQVPHEETLPAATTATSTGTLRTIAAIIPSAEQAWFFKATGESDQIEAVLEDFNEVVKSVQFEGDTPKWEVPDGWAQEPGNQFRFATIRKGQTEISVSKLPLPGSDMEAYLLANINRWREQISLPRVSEAELSRITKEVKLADRSAIVYDTGPASGSPTPRRTQEPPPSSPVTYEVPEGWRTEGRRPMRLATFTAERDDKKVEIVVSQLGPNAGSLVLNVNRWRGQIGLPEATEEDIKKDLKSVEVDGIESSYIQIVAEDTGRVIYVVIVKRPDLTLFVKLTGDRAVAEAEAANFEEFSRSIRFST